jgi:hypothetical protein
MPLPQTKKQKARSIREGMGSMQTPEGNATHLMAHQKVGDRTVVFPTIYPEGKDNYKPQSLDQAYQRGEVFEFKNDRRAERFAFGSWKKGQDKRDAMRNYREYRKEQRRQG